MKTLYLARHAKSSWDDMSLSDFERPLNKRGLRDAPYMGDILRSRGIKPDLIICSPSRRTKETVYQYIEKIGYPKDRIEFEPRLYEASAATLLSIIREQPESVDSLMIVGHNQGLTDLYNDLSPDYIENIPTGAVVCLRFNEISWKNIRSATGKLDFFEYPKLYFA